MQRTLSIMLVAALAACETKSDPEKIVFAPEGTELSLANAGGSVTVLTVASSDGTRGVYAGTDGIEQSFFPGCWACGAGVEIDREKYDALWPLAPGKAVTFSRRDTDGTTADVLIRVVGTERITLPNGDATDAWVLDTRLTSTSGAPWTAEMRTWWSDDFGWIVRATGMSSRGTEIEQRLVSITLPE